VFHPEIFPRIGWHELPGSIVHAFVSYLDVLAIFGALRVILPVSFTPYIMDQFATLSLLKHNVHCPCYVSLTIIL